MRWWWWWQYDDDDDDYDKGHEVGGERGIGWLSETLAEGRKVGLLWKYTLYMYDLYKGLIKYIKKLKNLDLFNSLLFLLTFLIISYCLVSMF